MRLLAAALIGLIGLAGVVLAEAAPQLEFRAPSGEFAVGFRDLAAVVSEPEGHLSYRLAPDAQAGLAAFTARNIGARMRVLVCGVQVSEAVVQARIDSGVFVHAVAAAEEAGAILAMVAADAECPPHE